MIQCTYWFADGEVKELKRDGILTLNGRTQNEYDAI